MGSRASVQVLARDDGICQLCGLPALSPEVDHIQPLHQGGAPLDPDNLRTVCRGCHIDRHRPVVSEDVAAWRALRDAPM